MTDNRLGEIKSIQKRIVNALETGEDVSKLRNELARVRAEIAADAEIFELKKIADARQALRAKAEVIKVKVQKQGEFIDQFLKLRDTLISQLQPLLKTAQELARMQSMNRDGFGECYAGFYDMGQFSAEVRGIPADYLGAEFGCSFLEMAGGQVDAHDKAREAYSFLLSAHGIYASFLKGLSQMPLKKAEGLLEVEPESEAGSCIVCEHAEAEAINNLLRQGEPLRDIESRFGVSRSSLSRHKNRCLNLGPVKFVEPESPASPAASANQTFSHG